MESLTLEEQKMRCWSQTIADSMDLTWQQGPGIPFIQIARFLTLAEKIGLTVNGKRCLDFGCGQVRSLSVVSLLYLLGAESVVAYDIGACHDTVATAQGLWGLLAIVALDTAQLKVPPTYRSELNKARIFDFDLDALREGHLFQGLPNCFEYHTGSYCELAATIGEMDIIVSNSVFEHDPDLLQTLAVFKKNLKSEGCIYSDIDYRDHRLYTNRASPWQYLIDNGDVAPNYINKIRASEMARIIEQAGFRIAVSEPVKAMPPADIVSQLHSQYRHLSYHDLSVLQDSVLLVHATE